MKIYENLWKSMKIYENLWRSMKIFENLNGCQMLHMLWNPMNNIPWNQLNPYNKLTQFVSCNGKVVIGKNGTWTEFRIWDPISGFLRSNQPVQCQAHVPVQLIHDETERVEGGHLLCKTSRPPGTNAIKPFTMVIYNHYPVLPSFCVIKLNYLSNYCGMAVNYNDICITNVIKYIFT